MSILDTLAGLLVLAAIAAVLNRVMFGLAPTAALVAMGAVASLAVWAADWAIPSLGLAARLQPVLASIDLNQVFLNGFLSALLFAGALHVDLAALRGKLLAVGLLATFGVLISTALVGHILSVRPNSSVNHTLSLLSTNSPS